MKTNYALILAATLASVLLVQPAFSDEQLTPAAPATPPGTTDGSKLEAAPAPKAAPTKKKSTAAAPAKKKVVAAEPLAPAVPLTPGPAIARQNNVNVRGQAAINSEVLTRLKRGDRVTVLEEVTLKKPKTDEPAKWAKIALPSNTAVWVHSSFIDATSKTVVPKRLNLRSGPSENYSVVGRIEKGTVVKEIERKGEWIKIEPPESAYAFVAAHLLLNEAAAPATPALAAAEPPKTPTPPTTPAPPTLAVVTPPTEMAVVTNAPAPATPVEIPPATPPEAPAVVTTPPGVTPVTTPPAEPVVAAPGVPATPAVAEPAPEEPLIKRVISREGVVKRSASIQAPSYFELVSLDTGKCVNYLFSTNSNLVLKDYRGQRIVVTGEEQLDERWPNTPVIYVDSVQPVQ